MRPQGKANDGHRARLRERYLQTGLDGFADHEILELLLGYCIAQKDTNPIGHALVNRFGNLQGVFDAPAELLTEVDDVGDYSAFLLKLIPDLCRRYYQQSSDTQFRFNDTAKALSFFVTQFIGRKVECLFAAFLNENCDLIECTLQYEGSINAVEIHADKLTRTALRLGAEYVILAHNHFNDSIPSFPDITATTQVIRALAPYKITLLDHFIICGSTGTSMRQSGHLTKSL
ncbi:MAG: RadC family protein [Clostridia bacterium]|nr:RadC family protein [Clostridia bacterium]